MLRPWRRTDTRTRRRGTARPAPGWREALGSPPAPRRAGGKHPVGSGCSTPPPKRTSPSPVVREEALTCRALAGRATLAAVLESLAWGRGLSLRGRRGGRSFGVGGAAEALMPPLHFPSLCWGSSSRGTSLPLLPSPGRPRAEQRLPRRNFSASPPNNCSAPDAPSRVPPHPHARPGARGGAALYLGARGCCGRRPCRRGARPRPRRRAAAVAAARAGAGRAARRGTRPLPGKSAC